MPNLPNKMLSELYNFLSKVKKYYYPLFYLFLLKNKKTSKLCKKLLIKFIKNNFKTFCC